VSVCLSVTLDHRVVYYLIAGLAVNHPSITRTILQSACVQSACVQFHTQLSRNFVTFAVYVQLYLRLWVCGNGELFSKVEKKYGLG